MWAVASLYLLLRAAIVSKIHTAQIQQSKTWIASHGPLDLNSLPTPYGKGHQKITKSASLECSSCPSNQQNSAETFDFQPFLTETIKVWSQCPEICETVDPALSMMEVVFICLYPLREGCDLSQKNGEFHRMVSGSIRFCCKGQRQAGNVLHGPGNVSGRIWILCKGENSGSIEVNSKIPADFSGGKFSPKESLHTCLFPGALL